MSNENNPYAPPKAEALPAKSRRPRKLRVNPAGFGIRFLARLIDTLFGLAVGFVAGLAAGVFIAAKGGDLAARDPLGGASILLAFLGPVAYHTLAEGLGGSTIGKLACGLRVISDDGSPTTLPHAFVRSLAYFIDGLFFGLVAYRAMKRSPRMQRVGDRWAHTVVGRPTGKRPMPSPLLGVVLGTTAWFVASVGSALVGHI